jgi:hypothetical protein
LKKIFVLTPLPSCIEYLWILKTVSMCKWLIINMLLRMSWNKPAYWKLNITINSSF